MAMTVSLTFECSCQIGLTPWWRWVRLWRLGRELRTAEAAAERAEHRRQLLKIEEQLE